MMIREANKFDLDLCIKMLARYSQESTIQKLRNTEHHSEKYIERMLLSLIAGRGFIFIDDRGKGFIVGIVTPNFWCPGVNEIKELAWWVAPEYRNGSVGGRLFFAFEKKAQELIGQGRASMVTMSLMANSPKIDLEARGYHKIESTYCKE